MTEWVEQWICIRFCSKLEHSSAETIQMIQKAFRDDAISAMQIQVWHKHFKDGQESVESDPCSEGLQQAEYLRMSNVHGLQSIKISNWPKLIWGFQKLLCPRFWCRILAWNVSWQNLFYGFCYHSRRNIVLQLGEMCEVPRCLLWRQLRCHCPMYNVSCSFFNKYLYFSYYMAGYLLDRPCTFIERGRCRKACRYDGIMFPPHYFLGTMQTFHYGREAVPWAPWSLKQQTHGSRTHLSRLPW